MSCPATQTPASKEQAEVKPVPVASEQTDAKPLEIKPVESSAAAPEPVPTPTKVANKVEEPIVEPQPAEKSETPVDDLPELAPPVATCPVSKATGTSGGCPFGFKANQSDSRKDFAAYKEKAQALAATLPKDLDDKTIAVIKATASAVMENMETITHRFYPHMFENFPQVKNYFNMAHHVTRAEFSDKRPQPFALAHALCRYIAHLEDPVGLRRSIELACQKHCALTIQAEHYPIVYECFMYAVGAVLGDVVTPEIADAWSKYVLWIARKFIERELEIYEQSALRDYGWFGFKKFTVVEKTRDTDQVYNYVFEPQDHKRLPSFQAGQYITLRFDNIPGVQNTQLRHYSVSSRPGENTFSIQVQLEPGMPEKNVPRGLVSNHLRDNVKLGDTVEVGVPFGTINLPTTTEGRPICLISGGIGCTVTESLLSHILADREFSNLYYIQQVRNGASHAAKDQGVHAAFQRKNVRTQRFYSKPRECDLRGVDYDQEGHLDIEQLKVIMHDDITDANYVFCGPEPLIHKMVLGLLKLGVQKSQIQFECFGPLGITLEEFVIA